MSYEIAPKRKNRFFVRILTARKFSVSGQIMSFLSVYDQFVFCRKSSTNPGYIKYMPVTKICMWCRCMWKYVMWNTSNFINGQMTFYEAI